MPRARSASILPVAALVLACAEGSLRMGDLARAPDLAVAAELAVADRAAGQERAADRSAADGTAPLEQECRDWKASHPGWIWCDDFEDGSALSTHYPDVGSTGFGIATDDALSGSHAVRQHYSAGQVDAGWLFWFYGDANGKTYGPPHQEIYVRWFHKFEPGFQGVPPKMARLSSIGPGFEKRFAVHYWIETTSYTIVADVHVPFSTQANSAGWLPVAKSSFSYKEPANIGRWICHELFVRNNTPGKTDGAYKLWADGKLIVERSNVDLSGSTGFNFNAAQLDCYWNAGSPKDQRRYYDNFVVATTRIGCGGQP